MPTMSRYPLPHYPLLTFPFLHYMESIDLKNAKMVEFGSGPSVVYWKKRCQSIISYEPNKKIYDALQKESPQEAIQFISFADLKKDKVKASIAEADYILVDTHPKDMKRFELLEAIVPHTKNDVGIILDNTTWFLKAKDYLAKLFFVKEFPGFNKINELTATSLYQTRKQLSFYQPTSLDEDGSLFTELLLPEEESKPWESKP